MTNSPATRPDLVGVPKVALSIWQPWAWLIVHGHKDVENRTWPTRFRGPLGIHAALKFDLEGYKWVRQKFPAIPMPEPNQFETGGLVGVATLFDCVDSYRGEWFTGPWGFVLAHPKPIPFVKLRGMQGFFNVKL